MPSFFLLDIPERVTPGQNTFGPLVAIGARATISIDVAGPVSMSIIRGDGELIENFDYWVHTRWYGPIAPALRRTLTIAYSERTLPGRVGFLKDYTPRTYRLAITAPSPGDTTSLTVYEAAITTSPYSPAGLWP